MMDASSTPTHVTIDRNTPLYPNGTPNTRTTSLNDRLNTNYVDIGSDDSSFLAYITRFITGVVGNFVTPRRLLVVLRVLKAITFCFLFLNVAATLMYIAFLEVLTTKEVRNLVGGKRDTIIRMYGLVLAVIAILIELDVSVVVKAFAGLRGFIPRALLLFLISAITAAHPLNESQLSQSQDDDVVTDDEYSVVMVIPNSVVVFQMVTSFIL
jgi:hypothetical protein